MISIIAQIFDQTLNTKCFSQLLTHMINVFNEGINNITYNYN
jgi:hypothetical protein